MTNKFLLNRSGMSPEVTCRKGRHAIDSILSRFSLASLICLCLLTVGVGNAWGAPVTVASWTGAARTADTSYEPTTKQTDNTSARLMSECTLNTAGTGGSAGAYYGTWTNEKCIYITGLNLTGYTGISLSINLRRRNATCTAAFYVSTDGSSYAKDAIDTKTLTNTSTNYEVSSIASNVQAIKIVIDGGSGNLWLGTASITGTAAAATPTVTPDPTSLDWGTVLQGSSQGNKTISITGSNLTAGTLTISASGGYSVTPTSKSVSGTLSSTTLTVTPPSTSTTGTKNGKVTISGGGLASDVEVNLSMTVNAASTVTWMNNGSEYTTTLVANGSKPTFPSNPSSCDGTSTTFIGWTQTPWSGKIDDISGLTTDATKVYTSGSAMPNVTGAVTYYAVFAKSNTTYTPVANTWTRITSTSQLTNGATVLLVQYYNDKAINTTPGATNCTANTEITNSTANLRWTAVESGSKWKFKSSSNHYLSTESLADGTAIALDESYDEWTISADAGEYSNCFNLNNGNDLEYYSTFKVYTWSSKYKSAYPFYIYIQKTTESTTYDNYLTNCCTNLASINGSIKSISGTSATLKWDDLSNVDATTPYGVTVSPSAGTSVGGISTVDGYKNCTVSGLTAGTEYTFTINAYGDATHCNSSQNVVATTPKITLGSASGTSTYIEGNGPGSKQTFTVTAVGLTGNLTVTAPTNFEVCDTENGTYASSKTLTATSGAVSTTVYFRLVTGKTAASSPYAGSVTVSGGSATSQTVSVNGTVSPACAPPTINTQPAANASYNLNVTATALSVVATKNGTGPALTYQWYSNTANSKTTPTPSPIDGATSASYTPPTTATGTKYYFCEVSSGACAVTTNISAITVNTPSITVSKTSIAFGDQAKDGSHEETFTVTGTNLASSTGLTLAVTGSSYFTIDKTSVAQTSAGAVSETTITVTYAPTVIGNDHSATITISSTGATNKTVTLSGNSKYKITWVDQAANPATETYTYVASGKPTFPSNPSGGCDSYTYFYGWAEGTFTTPVTAPTSSSTIKVYKSASEMPNVSGNTTYYAVWADSPGGWSEATSVSVGDVIVITNKANDKELTGIYMPNSTYLGKAESFTTTPNGTFLLTVVTGYESTGVALKNGDDYLLGSSSNDLAKTEDLSASSSWTLDYDSENDDWSITNNDQTTRRIRYNGSTTPSRFCTYTSAQSGIHIWKQGSEGNCVTSCCTEVAARSGSVTMGSTSATVSWSVTGTAASKISSWDVSCKVTSSGASAGTKGSLTTDGTTKSITFTGLTANTGYTFHILGTSNDDAYCDVDDELTGTTECATPSPSITQTVGTPDLCAGQAFTLSCSGGATGATYQWKRNGSNIVGATNSTYEVASATRANAGTYTCTVTNPGSGSCTATSGDYSIKVWTLYINNGDADAFQHVNFTNTGTGTGSNTTVFLTSDKGYEFKVNNGYEESGNWYGNSGTITTDVSNWVFAGDKGNCKLTSGIEGNYTFSINYSSSSSPTVSVSYPHADQPNNRSIWFDKSVVTGWNSEGTSDLYYRIGKSTNHTNNTKTGGTAWTLVPGTDKFYTTKTMAYDGFEAWAISNNAAWCDNSDDNHSIYGNATDSYKITKAIDFQKYVVGASGVTIVPTSSHNTDGNGCNYWYVTKTDGMLTHTATITMPTNGTITIANAAQSLNATTTTADLPHRTILTVTATPAPGYQLSTLTVNGAAFTSGNTHILAADATIAATFTAKTITITWDENGGNTPSPTTSSYTYNGSTVALATVTHATKLFAGWWTDPSAGTQITEIGTTNKPTDDVTYYAHWSDGNQVVFHPGVGSVTPTTLTQATLGGAVSAFPTPTIDCDGWSFAGWNEGSALAETTTNPEASLYAAGTDDYVPASATVHMYAVWKKNFGGGTGTVTNTFDWEAANSAWSKSSMSNPQSYSDYKHGGSYSGNVTAGGAYIYYLTKLESPLSIDFYYTRTSNNDNSGNYWCVQTSTNGSSWTTRETSLGNNSLTKGTYEHETVDLSSYSNIYVKLLWSNGSSSAGGNLDDVTISYTGTIADAWKWTSSADDYGCVPANQVKTPVITPAGGGFTGAQSITISCETDGATIRYTTDGTDPTSSVGTVYSGAFTLSCSGTVKAIAYKATMDDSNIASETYTIKTPNPTFSPDGGDFKVAQSVSLSDALAGTTIYYEYTTDGSEPSDPTASSTAYSSTIPVAIGQTVRIKAIGINACCSNSDIVSKTFRVGWDFELVTDEDDLNAGDKIVILSGTTSAMSTFNTGGNNRTSSSDFDISGTTVTAYPPSTNSSTTVQVITLEGGVGNWKLVTSATEWLNCPSAGKLTTVTTNGGTDAEKASRRWSIDIGSSPNYYATITNNNVTDATIQYGTVYAAYNTSQSPVKIYSLPTTDPLIKVDGTLTAFTGCTSEASAAQSFYVSGKNLSASILVTAPTGYEVSLSSGSGYAASVEVARVGTAVAKTQVYVRLKAGDAGAVDAANVVVSVSANSLSENVAIPAGTIGAADTYIDRMHGASTTYECGSYSAPNLSDGDKSSGTDCQKAYYDFMGWVAEGDINLDGTLKAGATVVHYGDAMTADGTTYYSIWAEDVE